MLFVIQKSIIILARTYHIHSPAHYQIPNELKKLPKGSLEDHPQKAFLKAIVGTGFGDASIEPQHSEAELGRLQVPGRSGYSEILKTKPNQEVWGREPVRFTSKGKGVLLWR